LVCDTKELSTDEDEYFECFELLRTIKKVEVLFPRYLCKHNGNSSGYAGLFEGI
jgi:hypothetical protein